MAWRVINEAKVVKDDETGDVGILCGCGTQVCQVGNTWKDVTGDFTTPEDVCALSIAVVAGNNVLHATATLILLQQVTGMCHLLDTDKWSAMVEGPSPVMVRHTDGTVDMLDGYFYPQGYLEADLTGVSTTDAMYVNLTVPLG